MRIMLNGREEILAGEMSLLEFLRHRELEPEAVIVELDRAVVIAKKLADVLLKDGSELEVLRFVGGG